MHTARRIAPETDDPYDVAQHPLQRPHALRSAAVTAAMQTLGADGGHYHMLVRGTDQIVRFHGVRGVEASVLFEATCQGCEGLAALTTDMDVDHIAPLNELGRPPDDFYRTTLWRTKFERAGYRRALYLNVTAGPSMRGHVSLMRRSFEPWDAPEGRTDVVAEALRGAFQEAWALEESLAPPEGAVTIGSDGSISPTTSLADWIDAHDAGPWLRAHAQPVEAGQFGLRRLSWAPCSYLVAYSLPQGGTLLMLSRVAAMELPPVLVRLTTLQRRVASLAAAGATAVEIARELDRSPETIREHLSRIYERLGVASRSELATLCRRMLF